MKLNIGKRILMFFHWLFSTLICAAFVLYLVKPDFALAIYDKAVSLVGALNIKIIGGAILAIYLVLAIVQIILILRRIKRSERGFITVDSSDTGRVRIAVSAIEQMVRQSVINIDGISEMKIAIDNKDDAIVIRVAASIVNGSHVPTITMNMQRAIRQFVEMNCGVAVRSIAISINSVTSANETPRRRRRGEAASVQPVPAVVPAAPAYAEPQASSFTEVELPELSDTKPQPAPEPVTSAAPLETEAPAEDEIPGIDFNYKPRLELTPTVPAEDEPANTLDEYESNPADDVPFFRKDESDPLPDEDEIL